MKVITLTDANVSTEYNLVYLNSQYITAFYRLSDQTAIKVHDRFFYVKETPSEILELLEGPPTKCRL